MSTFRCRTCGRIWRKGEDGLMHKDPPPERAMRDGCFPNPLGPTDLAMLAGLELIEDVPDTTEPLT